ncbi:MAG: sulfotransferase, partial [Thermomonas sp.]
MQTLQIAERQLAVRDLDGARLNYERLLADQAFRCMAYLRLSQIASSQGRYRESVEQAICAFNDRQKDAGFLATLAKRLAMLGETESAVACATAPEILNSTETGMLMEVGNLLASTSFPEQALALFERARLLGHDSASLSYLIGLNCMYSGDSGRARDELERSIRAKPDMGVALWALSKLQTGAATRPDWINRLRAAIKAKQPGAADMPLLQYALFRALDERGETDAAWRALSEGMRLQRLQVQYDASRDQALFDHLGGLGPQLAGGFVFEGPQPIFIVGMPRSGTTLLERILGHHPDVYAAGELHDLIWQLRWMCDIAGGPYLDLKLAQKAESIDFAELGRRYVAHTQWRAQGHAFYVDKMPANFANLSYIARAMPQAKILHMVRGSMDTCFSNMKECFANGYAHSNDQVEMADHYRRYHALMAHWRALYPDRILDVRYDDLVTQPDRVVSEVLAFCGLPWREGMTAIEKRTDSVATASAMQVRESIHGRFLQQWRRYESHLEPLRERLGPLAG